MIDVMYGSFDYAGYFAPESALGTEFFDGSTIWSLDVFSAVNKCLETHAPENIVVDVILTSARNLKTVDASNYKSIEMLWRFLEVNRYYNAMDGLLRAQFAYPTINFRNIIAPSVDLPDTRFPLVSKFCGKIISYIQSRTGLKPKSIPHSPKATPTVLMRKARPQTLKILSNTLL